MTGRRPGRFLTRANPATRLFLTEAVAGLVLSAVTLPVSTPGHRDVPNWVQLLGLAILLVMIAASVQTWRRTILGELRASPSTRDVIGATPNSRHEQARAERRVRWMLILYVVATVVLIPIPNSWVNFWFAVALLGVVGGMTSLALNLIVRR